MCFLAIFGIENDDNLGFWYQNS